MAQGRIAKQQPLNGEPIPPPRPARHCQITATLGTRHRSLMRCRRQLEVRGASSFYQPGAARGGTLTTALLLADHIEANFHHPETGHHFVYQLVWVWCYKQICISFSNRIRLSGLSPVETLGAIECGAMLLPPLDARWPADGQQTVPIGKHAERLLGEPLRGAAIPRQSLLRCLRLGRDGGGELGNGGDGNDHALLLQHGGDT